MRGKALLDELMEAARRRGVAVRREAMSRGTSAGGFCVLKGTPTIFVDERASIEAQVEVLAGALRRYDWSDVFLPPAVRALLERDAKDTRGGATG